MFDYSQERPIITRPRPQKGMNRVTVIVIAATAGLVALLVLGTVLYQVAGKKVGTPAETGANRAAPPPQGPAPLVMIFQHSRHRSVGKLWREDRPTPDGWTDGTGSITLTIAHRQTQLSAALAGGREGEVAEISD